MTTLSKRLTLAVSITVVVVIAVLFFAPASSRGYRAESFVIAKTYTNAFFARSFEADLIRTTPSVLRLRVRSMFIGIPGGGAPVVTNGVGIRIFTTGPTVEDAQRAANVAATQVCQTVLTNYGIEGFVAERANSARSYSYFHDSFQPAVRRLFKH